MSKTTSEGATPDRVLNFGSDTPLDPPKEQITPENLESHADKLPNPTGYRLLILPFSPQRKQKAAL